MPKTETEKQLARTFALLSKASARKKIYSHIATRRERPEVARLLRAMAKSEAVQARRLFNSLRGSVDTTDGYLKTVFGKEMPDILENYAELIKSATDERPSLLHALSQLRAAETRLRSFYSYDDKNINVNKNAEYFVCKFCGYLSVDCPPEKCPICGASRDAFHEVN
jgi:rubrerythrin